MTCCISTFDGCAMAFSNQVSSHAHRTHCNRYYFVRWLFRAFIERWIRECASVPKNSMVCLKSFHFLHTCAVHMQHVRNYTYTNGNIGVGQMLFVCVWVCACLLGWEYNLWRSLICKAHSQAYTHAHIHFNLYTENAATKATNKYVVCLIHINLFLYFFFFFSVINFCMEIDQNRPNDKKPAVIITLLLRIHSLFGVQFTKNSLVS